jgi:hypothetical protein
MPLLEEFITAAPAEARTHLRELLRDAPQPEAKLRNEISRHLGVCDEEAGSNEFLDLALARGIGEALLVLIQGLDANEHDTRNIVTAASRYYFQADDGDHDFDSILGFEDDAQVALAACQVLDRPKLADAIRAILPR